MHGHVLLQKAYTCWLLQTDSNQNTTCSVTEAVRHCRQANTPAGLLKKQSLLAVTTTTNPWMQPMHELHMS